MQFTVVPSSTPRLVYHSVEVQFENPLFQDSWFAPRSTGYAPYESLRVYSPQNQQPGTVTGEIQVGDEYRTNARPPLSATAWDAARLDAFTVAADGRVLHGWVDITEANKPRDYPTYRGLNPGYHDYELILHPSSPVVGLATGSWGPGRIDGLAVHADGSVSHFWWDSVEKWNSEPMNFPGQARGKGVAIVAMGVNELELYVSDTAGVVWRRAFRGEGWQEWRQLALTIKDVDLVAVRIDANTAAIFLPGRTDGAASVEITEVRVNVSDGSLFGPLVVPGQSPFLTRMAAASWGDRRTDLFAVVRGVGVLHLWRDDPNAQWSGPEWLPGLLPIIDVEGIAATAARPGEVTVLLHAFGEVLYKPYRTGFWGGWIMLPHGFSPKEWTVQ